LRVQTLPGLEKNLDQLVEQIRDEEAHAYRENIEQLREVIRSKDMKYQSLVEQREGEMAAMISIIKIAQQKIETFQHQMKVHAQTLAMYREKEEKAKRSPVIFMVPPSLPLLDSHLLSPSLSPALSTLRLPLVVVRCS
jgi:formate dehydrogenase maturation protein FdhE